MTRNVIEAELSGQSARVRVQTYEYDKPSEQTRRPSQHQLTLMVTRNLQLPRGYFGRLASGRTFPLGNLIYVPAGQSIWAEGPGGPHTMITCALPRGMHRVLAQFEQAWDDDNLARCVNLRSDWIVETMRRLGGEAVNPGFGSDILLDSLATALPVELVRQIEAQPAPCPKQGGLSSRQLRMIEEYICDWPGGGIKVADLASLAGLSRGHFMRAFKQSTGSTVHAYVEQARLHRAKAMLLEGEAPLKQIAARLGFSDPSSFSLAFRRKTGMAPGRFRALRQDA